MCTQDAGGRPRRPDVAGRVIRPGGSRSANMQLAAVEQAGAQLGRAERTSAFGSDHAPPTCTFCRIRYSSLSSANLMHMCAGCHGMRRFCLRVTRSSGCLHACQIRFHATHAVPVDARRSAVESACTAYVLRQRSPARRNTYDLAESCQCHVSHFQLGSDMHETCKAVLLSALRILLQYGISVTGMLQVAHVVR